MRPEHVAANKLIDIALPGDRAAYKAELERIERQALADDPKHGRLFYDRVVGQASMQYRMFRDYRRMGWRVDWEKRLSGTNNERQQGGVSDGKTDN